MSTLSHLIAREVYELAQLQPEGLERSEWLLENVVFYNGEADECAVQDIRQLPYERYAVQYVTSDPQSRLEWRTVEYDEQFKFYGEFPNRYRPS